MAQNLFDVTINGRGLLTYGLIGGTVDGLGLLTYGFVWPCGSIWDICEPAVETTWTACTGGGNVEACLD